MKLRNWPLLLGPRAEAREKGRSSLKKGDRPARARQEMGFRVQKADILLHSPSPSDPRDSSIVAPLPTRLKLCGQQTLLVLSD